MQELRLPAAVAWRWGNSVTEFELAWHVNTKVLLFAYRPKGTKHWTSVVPLTAETWRITTGTEAEAKAVAERFITEGPTGGSQSGS